MEPLKRHKGERHDVRETSPFLVLLGHCYFPRLTTAELGVVTILLNSNPNILRHTRSLWKPMRVIKLHLCLFCANTVCHKFCNAICVTVVFFFSFRCLLFTLLAVCQLSLDFKNKARKICACPGLWGCTKVIIPPCKVQQQPGTMLSLLCLYFIYRYQYHQSFHLNLIKRLKGCISWKVGKYVFVATNISLTILNKFTFNIQPKKCRIHV